MSFFGSMTVSEKMIQCVKVTDSSWHNQFQGQYDKEEEGGAAYSTHSSAAGGINSSKHECTKKMVHQCVAMAISCCTQMPIMFRKLYWESMF